MTQFEQWNGFEGRLWKEEINVRDFIQKNYKPYEGDESFLAGPTEATNKLWGILQKLQKEERAKGGVLDMDTDIVAGIETGLDTVLVLSGCTTRKDVENYAYRPHFILDGVGCIPPQA